MTLDEAVDFHNRFMVGFDLVLGSGALLAPGATLRVLGHDEPSEDAAWLFRRCGPIWLTFAAAHALAASRGHRKDWWALAWLRGTELATDALWARSPAFSRPGARAAMTSAGIANLAMTLAFGARGGAAGGDPAHGRHRHRGLGAAAAPDGAVGARPLPGPRPAPAGRPAGAGADRAGGPGQPGLLPQRAAGRRHRRAPRRLRPRPAARLDRGAERGGHPPTWSAPPSVLGPSAFSSSDDGRRPSLPHPLLPGQGDGPGGRGGLVARDDRLRAIDHVLARRPVADAAPAHLVAAGRADLRLGRVAVPADVGRGRRGLRDGRARRPVRRLGVPARRARGPELRRDRPDDPALARPAASPGARPAPGCEAVAARGWPGSSARRSSRPGRRRS